MTLQYANWTSLLRRRFDGENIWSNGQAWPAGPFPFRNYTLPFQKATLHIPARLTIAISEAPEEEAANWTIMPSDLRFKTEQMVEFTQLGYC